MSDAHIIDVVPDDNPLFGRTYRPVCRVKDFAGTDLESGCYDGPFVTSSRRAHDIGVEHARKMAGTWRPA